MEDRRRLMEEGSALSGCEMYGGWCWSSGRRHDGQRTMGSDETADSMSSY